jgi:hypothetical protein
LTFFFGTNFFSLKYAIIFDAGSSSTKMYIYTWRAGLSAARGNNIRLSEYYSSLNCTSKKTTIITPRTWSNFKRKFLFQEIGIDKIGSLDQATLYFDPCLRLARKQIPDARKSRAFIALAATAGMRLLKYL